MNFVDIVWPNSLLGALSAMTEENLESLGCGLSFVLTAQIPRSRVALPECRYGNPGTPLLSYGNTDSSGTRRVSHVGKRTSKF